MKRFYAPVCLISVAFAVLFTLTAHAQKAVKVVPPVGTGAIDGKSLFQEFCAVCHGRDARGNGPAAASLKMPATDLTQIAHRNNGKFPEAKVRAILEGDAAPGAHGNRDMPIWGKAFNDMSANLSVSQGRKFALVSYIQELQAK